MADRSKKEVKEIFEILDPGLRQCRRSLTASEQKALEIVLKLMKIDVIPARPWQEWTMGPIGRFPFYPLENPPGEEKERAVVVKETQYGVKICLRKSSKGDWFPFNLSIYNKAKDKRLDLESYESINAFLALAD